MSDDYEERQNHGTQDAFIQSDKPSGLDNLEPVAKEPEEKSLSASTVTFEGRGTPAEDAHINESSLSGPQPVAR